MNLLILKQNHVSTLLIALPKKSRKFKIVDQVQIAQSITIYVQKVKYQNVI